MNKKKKGIIYSTNPDFKFQYEGQKTSTLSNEEQQLKVCIDKHRKGKTVIIIKDFIGTIEQMKALGKILKNKCGVGGTVKNNEIIIQGDVREKIMEILKKEGYNYKRVGG